MLQATDLFKSYGATAAVAGVSFSAAPGEIVGLLGPNGAGKSTTVSMLCGIAKPDRGTVTLGGDSVEGDASPAKRRIGLVPQDISLFEDLPALDNLRLFGRLYGIGGARLEAQAGAALALVGLADRAKAKPATFSGGMKRRLNIACALVHDPEVLILDEPTAGVDPQSRSAIFENLEQLRARGKALVYTTHYLEEVERLCDRVVIVDHGKVVAAGTSAELKRQLPPKPVRRLEIEGPVDEALVAEFAARGIAVKGETGATLEDVFLHLTGRALRDGE